VDASLQSPADAARGDGDVTGVFWAPQFEGPLRMPPEDVDAYYAAYASFARVLRDMERDGRFMIEFRMQPGDIAVFNNRRMLHGRRVFGVAQREGAAASGQAGGDVAGPFVKRGGNRLLQGCYINVDEYKSRLSYLCDKYGGLDAVKRVANQQWF
jgi:gamma-butyrobetaine dioxygenase